MKHLVLLSALATLAALSASAASAGEPIAYGKAPRSADFSDKSGYTIFNPTPRELWRDLAPDRPDATESPITVDAGVWAIEASYFDWRQNNNLDSYTVVATNLKVGLTNDTDLQFVFDAFTHENLGGGASNQGFSDVQLRLKHNLWGNDGGNTAFALFPYIKLPTGTELSNGEVEGGLMLPFGMDLAEGLSLGLMGQIDAVYNDVTDSYDAQFLHTAVLGIDLTESIGTYLEYIGITGPGSYQTYFAGGFTYWVSEDLVFDWGTQIGLNDHSEDLGVFGGFTKRF